MSDTVYRDRRGAPVALGERIGAGGEGSVFRVQGRPELCAKIYLPEEAAAREDKIRVMVARPLPWRLRPSVAWPVEILHGDPKGDFAGFLMPAWLGMLELHQLIVPDERMAVAGWLTARDLYLVAARLAAVVERVHRAGHCVGDLKPQNILVDLRARRCGLIDTDSFQIADPRTGVTHRSRVVTPEYAAPELARADLKHVDRTPASDVFSLAVLIYQILLGGAHPYDGELTLGTASTERVPGRIRRGLCPLVPGAKGIRLAAGSLSPAMLPATLGTLFVRCFGEGHIDPRKRPSADEWRRALLGARKTLVRCAASGAHRYDRTLACCPFCERRKRTGIDLFPVAQGWQRKLPKSPAAASEPKRTEWLRQHVRGRLSAGTLTAAERAWIEKTGAGLGFDKARVAHFLGEEAARKARTIGARLRDLAAYRHMPRWPPTVSVRSLVLVSAASLVAGGTGAASVLAAARRIPLDAAAPAVSADTGREPRYATIGKTDGRGAFLRSAPSTTSDKWLLPEGTILRLTGNTQIVEGRAWSEIDLPRHAGWVASRYLITPPMVGLQP